MKPAIFEEESVLKKIFINRRKLKKKNGAMKA
jgi:hypothetical protein